MYYGRFCEYLHGDDGLACFSYLTFCANCADSAELVPAVVDVHVDCFLFDPSLKRCDANCDGLAWFGVRHQVKCSPVARCDPEVPPDEVGLVRPSEDA